MKKELYYEERNVFKQCRKKWHYRYIENLKRAGMRTWLSDGLYLAVCEYYKKNKEKDALIGSFIEWIEKKLHQDITEYELQEIEEIKKMGIAILENYYSFSQQSDNFKVLVAGEVISVSLPAVNRNSHTIFVCKVDGIVEDENENFWLLKHKISSSLDTSHLVFDEEVSACIWACQKFLDVKLKGTYYNVILKLPPQEPKKLRSGKLSIVKIKTTYDTFLKSIQKYNLDEKDYSKRLNELRQKGYSDFFKREKIYRNQKEIENIGMQLYYESLDMREAMRDIRRIYRNPSRNCLWKCEYKELCIAELDGSDAEYLRKSLYQQAEKDL